MAVQVVRFEYQNTVQWGRIHNQRITPVSGQYATTGEFIRQVSIEQLRDLKSPTLDLNQVRLLSPVTRNQQFVCQGAN